MTVIVASKLKNGKLVLGADRRITSSAGKYRSPVPKIEKRQGLIIGAAGDSYAGAIVQSICIFPARDQALSTLEYLYISVMPELVRQLRVNNIMHPADNRLNVELDNEDAGISVLLGLDNKLFEIMIDSRLFAIEPVPTPYAIGSGAPYALGAMTAMDKSKISVPNRIKEAIRIASVYDQHCDSEVDFVYED